MRSRFSQNLCNHVYLLALAGFLSLSLRAAETATNLVLKVTADHSDSLYRKGEPVIFRIALMKGSEPLNDGKVEWNVSKDGVAPRQAGELVLKNGTGALTNHLDEPGFLLCRVSYKPEGDKPVTGMAGAGIDPLKIGPSLPVPDDFDEFWANEKKKLAAIPINARMEKVDSPKEGVACFDLQADSVGAPVSGYFAKPVDAKPKSLPIILLVQGAGVRNSGLGGAANWAKEGFLAMDINAHGIPNGKPDAFYADLAKGELKGYPTQGRESRETMYFRGMFLRLVRALDVLTEQPEWDGKTVVVHGSSQGGAQSIVAAGLDPRVTFFAPGVAAMCDHSGAVVGRVSGWPKLVPNDSNGKPDPKILQAARYYDAMNFATRIKVPGFFTVGFIDTTCPPTSVYAAYNAVRAPKEIFNDPPSPHTVTPEAGRAMREAILKHVGKK
jgi:cephalosporin-C deacetylase